VDRGAGGGLTVAGADGADREGETRAGAGDEGAGAAGTDGADGRVAVPKRSNAEPDDREVGI
jgi:hypothetical protein